MAGNYPDVPGYRIAYDRDGTVLAWIDPLNAITQLTNANAISLNDESDSTYITPVNGNQQFHYLAFLFPASVDFAGYYFRSSVMSTQGSSSTLLMSDAMQTSTNTTNGLDGTWTTVANPYLGDFTNSTNGNLPTWPYYRNHIQSLSASAITAVRFRISYRGYPASMPIETVHLYGTTTSGGNPDRMDIWHPTLNQRLDAAGFDFGDTPRGSTADISFRVKNISSTKTANNITVGMEALTDTSPTNVSQYTMNYNGGTFASTQAIGSLTTGQISSVMVLRRTTPSNAVMSVWDTRVTAVAATWS